MNEQLLDFNNFQEFSIFDEVERRTKKYGDKRERELNVYIDGLYELKFYSTLCDFLTCIN